MQSVSPAEANKHSEGVGSAPESSPEGPPEENYSDHERLPGGPKSGIRSEMSFEEALFVSDAPLMIKFIFFVDDFTSSQLSYPTSISRQSSSFYLMRNMRL